MAPNPDPWIEAVAKLTALTQAHRLVWTAGSNFGNQDVIGKIYSAVHADRNLRLQRRRVRVVDQYTPDRPPEYLLEVVDDQGESLFAFPETEATRDLYEAVRYQTSGVKDFLNNLLTDE